MLPGPKPGKKESEVALLNFSSDFLDHDKPGEAAIGPEADPEGDLAVTFLCLQIGIWQRCQISRLFHEDAQGAQVIHLSILPP